MISEEIGDDLPADKTLDRCMMLLNIFKLQQEISNDLDVKTLAADPFFHGIQTKVQKPINLIAHDNKPNCILNEIEELQGNPLAESLIKALREHLISMHGIEAKAVNSRDSNDQAENVRKFMSNYLSSMILRGNFNEQFTLGKELGSGATAVVHECVPTPINEIAKNKFAVKIIKIGKKMNLAKTICFEMEILHSLNHVNVIKAIGCYFLIEDGNVKNFKICIIMELVQGIAISALCQQLEMPDKCIGTMGSQILQGLKYLHGIDIVHRDLKGDNIIFDFESDLVKLSNFILEIF